MKVFRLYKEGADTYSGWHHSDNNPYNEKVISSITDPSGAVSTKEITSIPSPFARIDLVKTAFAEINRLCADAKGDKLRQHLNGNTIYHKMVSDALDVGEMFFNLDKYPDQLEVIVWRPEKLKTQSETGSTHGVRSYARALATYWEADAVNYNFDPREAICILNYKKGDKPMNVIGATSPATLFFCNANDLSYIKDIQFNQDRPFDGEYQPLYKRDADYVEYLWWLKNNLPQFATRLPEVDKYLQKTFEAVEDEVLRDRLKEVKHLDTEKDWQPLCVKASDSDHLIKVCGQQLYQKKQKSVETSDFLIASSKQPDSKVLVLPIRPGSLYADWQYTTGQWGESAQAPLNDALQLSERRLPIDNRLHPYLTIGDFLEDMLIQSPYKQNENFYYDADQDGQKATYLLPLKPLFFEYFSLADLKEKQMLRFESCAGGGVNVVLKVPTHRGQIEYQRLYTVGEGDLQQNRGSIVDEKVLAQCQLSLMPAVRMPQGVQAHYVAMAIASAGNKFDLAFYADGRVISPNVQERTSENTREHRVVNHTMDTYPECVQLRTRCGSAALVVPTFDDYIGENEVSFAVDLGTSTTHVEYAVNGSLRESGPLDYNPQDRMQAVLFPLREFKLGEETFVEGPELAMSYLTREGLPEALGKNSTNFFPTRTALAYAKNIDWSSKMQPLMRSNLFFPYGKDIMLQHDGYATDIKWDEEERGKVALKHYVRNLLFLLRNKVLCLRGKLDQTQIVWFFPTSMPTNRVETFQELWNKEAQDILGCGERVQRFSESVAPAAYHTEDNTTAKNMVTIDIGGGTTDMAFSSNGRVLCNTSFRFAANALFEDSFSTTNGRNGITEYFWNEYAKLTESNDLLKRILYGVRNDSTNLASTFFTLGQVPSIKEKMDESQIDFISKLRNTPLFKLEFVLFYAAILWHAGRVLRAKDLPLPRHLAFSGNGSNLLKVLATPDAMGSRKLADFSKRVLEASTGQCYDAHDKLELLGFAQEVSPKSITCKGGLLLCEKLRTEEEPFVDPESIVLLASAQKDITKTRCSELTTNDYADVVTEVEHFLEHIKKMDREKSFEDLFGIEHEAWRVLDDVTRSRGDLQTFVERGLSTRVKHAEERLVETLFFYPIASILQLYSLEAFSNSNA